MPLLTHFQLQNQYSKYSVLNSGITIMQLWSTIESLAVPRGLVEEVDPPPPPIPPVVRPHTTPMLLAWLPVLFALATTVGSNLAA